MNKGIFVLILTIMLTAPVVPALAQDNDSAPLRYDRAAYYTEEGALEYIDITYSDGSTEKKVFDNFGRIVQKHVNGELSATYEHETVDGVKSVMETDVKSGTTVKRVFNGRGEIIASEYPDYTETYEYEYDSVGDVTFITVTHSNGETTKLSPTDSSLSFLNDYGVLDSDESDIAKDLYEREYLFNPTRYRDKIMRRHKDVNR